jgi:phosphoglycerol transferase MdoB-like AlkP superfamily enzyme
MVEARNRNLVTERTTMLVIGLIFAIAALGFFCWLLFNLAVYALPCFVAVSAGFWSYHHGSGIAVAVLVGILAAAMTLIIGQLAFARLRTPLARTTIALLFTAPAGFAGYYAALGLVRDMGAGPHWCDVFGILGALLIGATAFARLASGSFAGPTAPRAAHDDLVGSRL